MQSPLMILALCGILLSVVALVAGVRLESSKRAVKVALFAIGVLGVGTALFVIARRTLAERHESVEVAGIDDSHMFSFSFEHERQYFDGTSYHFTSDVSWAELAADLSQQFPQGEVISDRQWELSSATTPIVVQVSSPDSHDFVAVRQKATIGAHNNEGGVEFAYPSGDQKNLQFEDGVSVPGVGYAELLEYYKGLEGIEFRGDDVVIPASEGFVVLREDQQVPVFTRATE